MHTSRSTYINDLPELLDTLAEHQRCAAKIAMAAARFEAAGAWGYDGSVSMAAWLRNHAKLSSRDATKLLREGRFLNRNDVVSDAAVSGTLSASQVAALRAAVNDTTADLFTEHQQILIEAIAHLPVADGETVCQQWRDRAEALVEQAEPKVPERSWKSATLEDGTMVGRFVLDPASAAQMTQAIGTAKHWDAQDARTTGMRDADAVIDILAFFNANHTKEGTPRHRPHVEMFLGTETDPTAAADPHGFLLNGVNLYLKKHAFTSTGKLLSESTTDQHLCDCVIHRVFQRGSAVVDYGRSTRTVAHNLFRAVACRDTGCRFPGCDRPVAWTQAHHIHHWRRGGPTRIDNLILLCHYHHKLVHRDKWQIQLQPNALAIFIKPDGQSWVSSPRGSPHLRDPIAA
jgi:hypothetical protein